MVTNRDRKLFWSRRKSSKICSDTWHRWFFVCLQAFQDPIRGELPYVQMFLNDGPNPLTWYDRCSAIDLSEIRRSSKISWWIWSIISGVVTVLGRPGRGASQVQKSPRLCWDTQFFTVAYGDACPPNVSARMALISFGALPCREKKTWWQLASPCCWNCARSLTCFLSAFVTIRLLQFSTWTDPSFQQHYRFRPTTSGNRFG